MAQKIPGLNRKALRVLGVLSLFSCWCGAFEYKVGGPTSTWAVPADPTAAIYNQWAEKNRFQIRDTLLFVYDADNDSVLHVTYDDYKNCNTVAPLERFTDGQTLFTLNQSGPYYFISGLADNCHENQKLVVVVMADRSKHKSNETVSSPAPAGEESPSPPNPTSAPSQESSPPTNGASPIVSVVGAVAALVACSAVLAI